MLLDPPKDRRRRRTIAAVLAGAQDLFGDVGYRAATVEAIAEAADVAVSTIYANFPGGKADVYVALAWQVTGEHVREMTAVTAEDGTPTDRTVAAFDAYIDFHRRHPLALRLLALHDIDSADTDLVRDARRRIDVELDGVARQLISLAAEAVSPATARPLVLHGWAAINGAFALRRRGQISDTDLDEVLDLTRIQMRAALDGEPRARG